MGTDMATYSHRKPNNKRIIIHKNLPPPGFSGS